jgi:hypothetical protein
MDNFGIVYLCADAKSLLKRNHFQTAFGCNNIVIKKPRNTQSIYWGSVALLIIDYTVEDHDVIERVVDNIITRRLPTLVALDVKNDHIQKEVVKASEIPYHFKFDGQANVNQLREFYNNAVERYKQFQAAYFKWPKITQASTFQEIARIMPRLDIGATNYVLTNVVDSKKAHATLLQKANLEHVDSSHIVSAVNRYSQHESFCRPLLNQLNKRGDFQLSSAKLEAHLALKSGSNDELGQRLTSLAEDTLSSDIAERAFKVKLTNNEVRGVGNALFLSIPNRTSRKEIVETLCARFMYFVSDKHRVNSAALKHEFTLFAHSLSQRIKPYLQSELKLLWCAALAFCYHQEKKYYAATICKMLAVQELSKCKVNTRQITDCVKVLLMWVGDIAALENLTAKHGEHKQKIKGNKHQQERYKQLLTLYRSRSNIVAVIKLLEVFPHSEVARVALYSHGDKQLPLNLKRRYLKVERKLQPQVA